MKKIGLIGGMSWESSLVYYRILNEKVRELLGGFHSSHCVMESVDFAGIEKLQHQNNWAALNEIMAGAARNLERAGADLIVLCTNSMHLCSEAITTSVDIPFLHIARATAEAIHKSGIGKVLLLGTRFTMESTFYSSVLQTDFGIGVMIPNEEDRKKIHRVVYEELVQGVIRNESREEYKEIIEKAVNEGAQGVILGCTEIPLLIDQQDVSVPVFDTTRIHAESAVEWALKN